jgi:molecular chaperone HtpG
MTANVETFQFQAEARQVLELMIHSLYTNKEIFLRELISNASDATDRLRFEALSKPELIGADDRLEILVEMDSKERTVTVHDNGIGMSRQEVITNIGTIAKSGTRELMQTLKESKSSEIAASLIGQFGVGFYSAFMVADRVTLITRRAGEESGTQWESTGDGSYSISEARRFSHGTSITLHLKPIEESETAEDFTKPYVIESIIKKYSDFVTYPIRIKEKDGKESEKPINSMKPIWTRPRSEVKDEEYKEFYKHISHDWNEPMRSWSFRAEGRSEYQALLYAPSEAPFDLYYQSGKWGLHLYVRRVLIMEHCQDLLPPYLRFMRGVVDSADLPLNVSRQRLQEDRHIEQIRKWLTRKVLDSFEEMHRKEPEEYIKLWKNFGRVLKEGTTLDFDNKDRLLGLFLFESSADAEKLTTLEEYVSRMKEGQAAIYYITGPSRRAVEHSPHLEAFQAKGYEVLFLTDPVDEMLVQWIWDYKEKKLKSVAKGVADLGDDKDLSAKVKEFSSLMDVLQSKLDANIRQVRLSGRLTSSPVCLVVADQDMSPNLEALLGKAKGDATRQKRIMEINPEHELVAKMRTLHASNAEDPALDDFANILYGYALLAEGSEIPEPEKFNEALLRVVTKAVV